jgi:pyruvate formate lyase activating enzyme
MSGITGILFDMRRYAIHDGPGIRTAIFFKGCPLDCWWCHNPESQRNAPELILRSARCTRCGVCLGVCPNGAVYSQDGQVQMDWENCLSCGRCTEVCFADGRQMVGREYGVEEVIMIVERDRDFYAQSAGGVTFTGGEPLIQPGFLFELLTACKSANLHTVLDTSGFAAWETLDRVRANVDLFLYDLKMMDDQRHREYTGVSNRLILENLGRLSAEGHNIWLRIPIIPGINDQVDNLNAIGVLAASLAGVQRINLLPYHASAEIKYNQLGKSYRMPEVYSPSIQRMQEIAHFMQDYCVSVQVGG